MQSLINNKLKIGISKHSHPKIGLWRWALMDAGVYGLALMGSNYEFTTSSECKDNFKEFANLNEIKEFEFVE